MPFNDTERLVIELADAMTNTPSNVSDELYTRLRNQFSGRTANAIGRTNRVRKLSRTLEPRFQRRERQSVHAGCRSIARIAKSLKVRCGSNYCWQGPVSF